MKVSYESTLSAEDAPNAEPDSKSRDNERKREREDDKGERSE